MNIRNSLHLHNIVKTLFVYMVLTTYTYAKMYMNKYYSDLILGMQRIEAKVGDKI